jgi:tetratricopeptide (TPR) repeat protein
VKLLFIGVTIMVARPALAQTEPELLQTGTVLAALHPAQALPFFQRVLSSDSLNPEASWKTALVLTDLGLLADSVPAERDSLYREAEVLARRAVQLAPERAEAHFSLAVTLGRMALTKKSKSERARYATEVWNVAHRAEELDPRHDGVQHVLGLWHAEVMRLSGLSRFIAKRFMGVKVFGQARWEEAIRHLEAATQLDPERIFHHLDLARVYINVKRWEDARRQLAMVPSLPDTSALDARYRREAAALLAQITNR